MALPMESIAFLGCSRGLGKQVCLQAQIEFENSFSLLVARNSELLSELSLSLEKDSHWQSLDFSKEDSVEKTVELLKKHSIKKLCYFAAGGPYGNFADKKWKDHMWSLQVSFLTPARLLHACLSDSELKLEQVIFIGSTVADSRPDPMASSYAASKHGLKGLVSTVIAEKPGMDLRFFRPGYMDTDLLPANTAPRLEKSVLDPKEVAWKFWQWTKDPEAPKIMEMSS